MGIIVLEGNECNYKTTIAENLSKVLGYEIVKGSSFELSQCTNDELFAKFKSFLEMDNIILDRFIYSNLVYASLYDDYSILSQSQVDEIESIFKNKGVVVYLSAPTKVIQERITVRGDDYVDVDKVESINLKYSDVMTNVSKDIHLLHCNTNKFSSRECTDKILQLI